MSLQHLQTVACVRLPYTARFIGGGCEYPRALRVEAHLRDLSFVSCEDCVAGTSHSVVHAGISVSRGRNQLRAGGAEGYI
jgi:hypothetical protein